jgi:hypothetical protein
MSWHITRMISDVTIGTAIVLVHVAMADRHRRTDRRGARGLGFRLPDAPRDAPRVFHD